MIYSQTFGKGTSQEVCEKQQHHPVSMQMSMPATIKMHAAKVSLGLKIGTGFLLCQLGRD